MKVLNLYCGIGGNRKLWNGVDVTAVEINPKIAKVYQDFFPNDEVVVGDAHQYLLEHYNQFCFIWSSPPCQSHSVTNHFSHGQGVIRYPDIKIYEEIIFLNQWCRSKWVVENVKSYYKPMIKPYECGRHYFWANFTISDLPVKYDIGTMNRQASKGTQRKAIIREAQIPELIDLHGLKNFDLPNKRQVLRNAVLPVVGKHVFDCAFKLKQNTFKVDFKNFDKKIPDIIKRAKKIKKRRGVRRVKPRLKRRRR